MDELINWSPIRIIVRMLELDCFLRYCITAATVLRGILHRENPMYTYWRGQTLQRRVVLNWFYSLSRRNTFVGGTCAPPSALLR